MKTIESLAPSAESLDPVAHLRALEARKVSAAEAAKRDAEETTRKIEALYALQHPVNVGIQGYRAKLVVIAKISRFMAALKADHETALEVFHQYACDIQGVEARNGLVESQRWIFHLDTTITQLAKSVERIRAEADNIRAEAVDYATKNNLGALLAQFDAPLDE